MRTQIGERWPILPLEKTVQMSGTSKLSYQVAITSEPRRALLRLCRSFESGHLVHKWTVCSRSREMAAAYVDGG
jgi:hypothetical protein